MQHLAARQCHRRKGEQKQRQQPVKKVTEYAHYGPHEKTSGSQMNRLL
jgi:hypothetical protein